MAKPEHPAESLHLERIAVDQIRVYDRNPRSTPNPEYDRIKQSIREHGLEQPLIVADCPDGPGYVVCAGGNTRLSILKELNTETDEERFGAVECVVRPWESPAAALMAHLRENDLRGALSFIDRARAVVELHRLFESQDGSKLSQRQLAARLTENGYAVSQALISPMFYAVEVLEPLLPAAFAAGLGRRPVERLRALDRAASAVWKARRLGSQAECQETFAALCRRSDGPDWSFEAFRGALELEIATAADARIHTIRLELDQVLDGSAVNGVADPVPPVATRPSSVPEPPRAEAPERHDGPPTNEVGDDEPAARTRRPSESVSDPDDLTEIAPLRTQAWTLAHRLAGRYGLSTLVLQTPEHGVGFTVAEIPDESVIAELDAQTLGQLAFMWWHLVAAAELLVAPSEVMAALLPRTSATRNILESQTPEVLFERLWTPDPGQMGVLLWRALPEADWQDLLTLMGTYRRLHTVARSLGEPLWALNDKTHQSGS